LRSVSKEWKRNKRRKDKEELNEIRRELASLYESTDHNSLSLDLKNMIRKLEKRKNLILSKEEATWRLKSRPIWLKEGDRNTRFFHKFASARREKNSIWSIKDEKGNVLLSQHEIAREAVRYFQNQYRRREVIFQDALWGIELVPKMFNDVANEDFIKPVSEEELLKAIKSFKKDKSPGPDG